MTCDQQDLAIEKISRFYKNIMNSIFHKVLQGGTVTIATKQGQQRKASEADPGTHIATAPMPIQNKRAKNFTVPR